MSECDELRAEVSEADSRIFALETENQQLREELEQAKAGKKLLKHTLLRILDVYIEVSDSVIQDAIKAAKENGS